MKRIILTLSVLAAFVLPSVHAKAQFDVAFGTEVIRQLSSPEFKGRGYNQHGDSIAAQYLRATMRQIGLRPLGDDYYQHYTVVPSQIRIVYNPYPGEYHTQNVVGYIPGESDSMVVVTAHYDHLGIDTLGNIYYGAHDNASGCGAVLTLAKYYAELAPAKPHYTIVVMLFSGEEAGLLGSHYASQHPIVDFSKVRLLCNIDMFCGGDEGFMIEGAEQNPNTQSIVDRMLRINAQTGLSPVIRQRKNAPNSDHYYFTPLCPAMFIYTLGGPYGGYHSPADNFEGCGLAHFADYLSLISNLLE